MRETRVHEHLPLAGSIQDNNDHRAAIDRLAVAIGAIVLVLCFAAANTGVLVTVSSCKPRRLSAQETLAM